MAKRDNKEKGKSGEQIARYFLQKNGLEIMGQNINYPFGEIDILGREKDVIVIVEVKMKRGADFGIAQDMITWAKKEKLRLLARQIQKEYPKVVIRIDVVAINFIDGTQKIEYIRNAVEGR